MHLLREFFFPEIVSHLRSRRKIWIRSERIARRDIVCLLLVLPEKSLKKCTLVNSMQKNHPPHNTAIIRNFIIVEHQ